jgi:hypothetical protein
MRLSMRHLLGLLLFLFPVLGAFSQVLDPFSAVLTKQRDALSKRLDGYVDAYRHRDWEKLYEYISKIGRGDSDTQTFVVAMRNNHGEEFAQYPEIKIFKPQRSMQNDDGYDIYGCGEAVREDEKYNGLVVVHAVFERQDWFFTGWTFRGEDCKALSDPKWQPDSPIKWNKPMEEIAHIH